MHMTHIRDVDYDKYNTFFLEYYKFSNKYCTHVLRPSEATYKQITDTSKDRIYTLEGAIATFDYSESLSQVLLECASLGITVDFIDIKVPCEQEIDTWDLKFKIFQVIDTHKDDVRKYIDKLEVPRHYIVLNKNKTDVLKFLIVDSALQSPKTDFLKGEYDKNAVIAGFRSQNDANVMCKSLNREK